MQRLPRLQPPTRPQLAGLVLGLLVFVTGLVWFRAPWVTPITGDRFDRLQIDYRVRPDGSVTVREDATIHFGLRSRRHGLSRAIVTQRALDHDNVLLWPVTDITASSPSGHNAQVHKDLARSTDGSTEVLWIRLGDPARGVRDDTARYVLEYTQLGLVRPAAHNQAEFSINTLGRRQWVDDLTVTVTTPEPAQGHCWIRAGACLSSTSGTTTTHRIGAVRPWQEVTVAATLPSSAAMVNSQVQPLQEHLVLRYLGSRWWWLPVSLAAFGLSWLFGRVRGRSRAKDERWTDLAPGTIPAQTRGLEVGEDHRPEIPVRFSPPAMSVAEAGLLLDGRPRPRHLAATLVSLACQRVITLEAAQGRTLGSIRRASSGAPRTTLSRTDQAVATALFRRGDTVRLTDDQVLHAHAAMADLCDETAVTKGWMTRPEGTWTSYQSALQKRLGDEPPQPKKSNARKGKGKSKRRRPPAATPPSPARPRSELTSTIVIWAAIGILALSTVAVLATLGPALPLLGPLMAVIWGSSDGRQRSGDLQRWPRTPLGRALTDQVEGFRLYLTTAEAGQLDFQEEHDIFTGYLPWAVLFGCADRWARVCRDAVDAGLAQQAQVELVQQLSSWKGLDSGLGTSFSGAGVDRSWEPPTPSSSADGWGASDGGAGSGGSGGSFGSW